jgi:predicted MFS family arabinose efflux permease
MPRRARAAVTVVFLATGWAFGNFVSRLPALQDDTGASEGELGLALFGMAVGAVLAMPLAGWVTARVGSRTVTRVALIGMGLSLPLPSLARDPLTLGCILLAYGAWHATLDVAMNAHGVAVESRYDRPILSSFHAAFSGGGLLGAASGGIAASLGVEPTAQFLVAAAAIVAIGLGPARLMLPRGVDRGTGGPVFGRPSRDLVALSVIAFACLFAEGAASDWSAVYLNESVGTGEGAATLALIGFSVTMTVGRLLGDRATARWGAVRLLRAGGALGALALAAALLAGDAVLGVAGFTVLGACIAVVIPVVFRAAGAHAVSASAGIAAVATVGYTAFLAAPTVIGGLAELITLRGSLAVVVGLLALIAVLAPAAR